MRDPADRPARRILVVTVVHHPLDARIHRRQIGAMVEAGWRVTYAAPWRGHGADPAAAGDGVTPLELPRASGRRRLGALRAARALLRREAGAHDVVLLHDPELVLAVGPGYRGPPVVLDVHEDLAASLVDRPWIPRLLGPAAAVGARILERLAERRVSLLLAETSYAQRFARPWPVVRNVPPLPADPPAAGRDDRVVYLGRVSRGRGAIELVLLARALADDGIRVEVVGQADDDVAPMLAAARDQGILEWAGRLPNEAAMARLPGALAGLSLLHDLPNYRGSLPTKAVEYLAAGLPVITTPLPEAAALVEAAGAGTVVGFRDVAAAADAVRALASDRETAAAMGRRGRRLVAEDYRWDTERDVLLDALAAAADSRTQEAASR